MEQKNSVYSGANSNGAGKGGEIMNHLYDFVREEEGVGVVEIILILVGIFTPYYGVGIRCMA